MVTTFLNYEEIDRPYNNFLQRTPFSDDNGNVEKQPVKTDGGMSDVWIKNFIRSDNWQPKTQGFYIDGQSGYAEFSSVFVSGSIEALSGKIGSKKNYWSIGANGITATADTGDVFINYGKTGFTDYSTNGFILGYSGTEQLSKFLIGSATEYIEWDGVNLNIVGSIDISSKLDKVGGAYNSSFNTSRVMIFPNSAIGVQVTDNNGSDAFVVYVGTYGDFGPGDVAIGNISGKEGILYDQSTNTTTFYGHINQSEMTSSEIIGSTLQTAREGERIVIYSDPSNRIDFKYATGTYGQPSYVDTLYGRMEVNHTASETSVSVIAVPEVDGSGDPIDPSGFNAYVRDTYSGTYASASMFARGSSITVDGNSTNGYLSMNLSDGNALVVHGQPPEVHIHPVTHQDSLFYFDRIELSTPGVNPYEYWDLSLVGNWIPSSDASYDLGQLTRYVNGYWIPDRYWRFGFINAVVTTLITSINDPCVTFGKSITLASQELDTPGLDDGSMYYNVLTGYIRVKQAGVWANLGSDGSGANTTLSNLGTTAINAALNPDSSGSYNLGSSTARWKNVGLSEMLYLGQMSGATAAGKTAANGAMYYRTDDGVIRVYLNGAWTTLGGGGGASALSALTIDTSKDWLGYSITNMASITLSGTATMNGKMKIPVGINLY